mmetsp:Transcript_31707/g.66470  ORF Transcript_31707/g.66470 Transcript_31707/m.66470 type:complete len:191 (-) Transcript_31707:269-841(-)
MAVVLVNFSFVFVRIENSLGYFLPRGVRCHGRRGGKGLTSNHISPVWHFLPSKSLLNAPSGETRRRHAFFWKNPKIQTISKMLGKSKAKFGLSLGTVSPGFQLLPLGDASIRETIRGEFDFRTESNMGNCARVPNEKRSGPRKTPLLRGTEIRCPEVRFCEERFGTATCFDFETSDARRFRECVYFRGRV